MTATYRVTITRKPGLSDPEGATTRKALNDLGFTSVTGVAFGRILTIEVAGSGGPDAEGDIRQMCEKLLANPVIETYHIEPVA